MDNTIRTTTTTCPHCGKPVDASTRQTGDTVYHPDCGEWYRVIHQGDGTTQLVAADAPAMWPKERRRP
jgi:hypothetical protein